MGRPFNEITRPVLHAHNSYHGHEKSRTVIDGDTPPDPIYECYEIKPKESTLGEDQGRWYRADTKRMHTSQRDLQKLVRDQSSSSTTAIEALLDRKMQGSKRKLIYDFIDSRDSASPERKHHLVFLRLDRNPKKGNSKKARPKTLSMHVILEGKLRPRNNVGLPLPRSMSSQGPFRATGDFPTTTRGSAASMLGTVSAPINTPRPQYLPSYSGQTAQTWLNRPPKVQISNSQNGMGQPYAPSAPRTTIYDSDGLGSLVPSSSSSPLSSDTIRLSSQRPSSTSSPMDTPSISLLRTSAHCARGGHDSGAQCSYVSNGTQTDIQWNTFDDGRLVLTPKASLKVREEPGHRAETGKPCVDAFEASSAHGIEANTSSIDEQPNKQGIRKLENAQEATNVTYEKPIWMHNMQPVNTPTFSHEGVDLNPVDVDGISVNKYQGPNVAEYSTGETLPLPEETPGRGKGQTSSSSHVPRPVLKTASPSITPQTSSGHLAENAAFMRNDVKISEALSGVPRPARPQEGYFPPSAPLPNPQLQPRRHSDDATPPQTKSKSKSVRFDLSTHASTAPNTPITGTPPSSPSSSSSSEPPWSPKTPAKTTHPTTTSSNPPRPLLPRSSHSTSTYTRHKPPHLPQPSRSSSYRDLLRSHANNEEEGWWLTVPTNVNRRQSASAQQPVRRPVERCRESGFFASKEELGRHGRAVHGVEHRGSI